MTTTNDAQANAFDFSTVVDSLERFFDNKHPDYDPNNKKAGYFVFDNPLFTEFVEHYFAGNFIDNAWNFKDKSYLPQLYPEIKLEEPYKTVISARNIQACLKDEIITQEGPNRKNIRGATIYPLTFDETESAINFIHNNDDYFLAMNAINACIVKYYESLIEAITDRHSDLGKPYQINISPAKDNESRQSIKSCLGQAYKTARKNLTFIHDLTTQIAGHIQDEADPFSKRSMISGFKKMFERSAFQSITVNGVYNQCPFKDVLMDMMRVGLTENADGTLNATPNQHNGCLIKDVRAIIRRDHYQALPTPMPYDI